MSTCTQTAADSAGALWHTSCGKVKSAVNPALFSAVRTLTMYSTCVGLMDAGKEVSVENNRIKISLSCLTVGRFLLLDSLIKSCLRSKLNNNPSNSQLRVSLIDKRAG